MPWLAIVLPLLGFAETIYKSIPQWIAIFNKTKEGTPEQRAEFRKRVELMRRSEAWTIDPDPE